MSNQIDIIHVQNYSTALKLAEFFYNEGFDAGISSQEIATGTDGNHTAWRIDVLERPIIKECMKCGEEKKIFEDEKCQQCFCDDMMDDIIRELESK